MAKKNNNRTQSAYRYLMAALAIIIVLAMLLSMIRF
jgi:hypothetical protein